MIKLPHALAALCLLGWMLTGTACAEGGGIPPMVTDTESAVTTAVEADGEAPRENPDETDTTEPAQQTESEAFTEAEQTELEDSAEAIQTDEPATVPVTEGTEASADPSAETQDPAVDFPRVEF